MDILKKAVRYERDSISDEDARAFGELCDKHREAIMKGKYFD